MKINIKAVLAGGAAAAALAAALSGAGTANASCASLNGHGIGKGCESNNGGLAIGIGHNAEAEAYGRDDLAGTTGPGPAIAIAVGNPGHNPFYNQQLTTKADARGSNVVAVAVGNGSRGGAWGTNSSGIVIGHGSNAFSYGGHTALPNQHPFGGNGNHSLTVGDGTESGAVGNDKTSTAFGNHRQRQNNGLNG